MQPVESLGLRQDIPRHPVAQVLTYEERSIALVDLGTNASEALRATWCTDRPFQPGGVIESAGWYRGRRRKPICLGSARRQCRTSLVTV